MNKEPLRSTGPELGERALTPFPGAGRRAPGVLRCLLVPDPLALPHPAADEAARVSSTLVSQMGRKRLEEGEGPVECHTAVSA